MPRIVAPQVPQSRHAHSHPRTSANSVREAHLPYSESRLKAPPSAYTPSETA